MLDAPILGAVAAPAAPLIPALTALVAFVVALGMVMLAMVIAAALFRVADTAVGWIPWLGGKAKRSLHAIERRLNEYLSDAAVGLEKSVASAWHALANAAEQTGAALVDVARTTADIAWYVTSKYSLPVLAYKAGKAVVDSRFVHRLVDTITDRVVRVVRVIEHPRSGPIAAGVRWGTRAIDAEIDRLRAWTRAQVTVLKHAATVALPGAIGQLRDRDRSLGRLFDRLAKRVKRHERLLGAGAMAAAVAYALARLGGTWIRCGNARKAGRVLCGMDASQLDDLLAGSLIIVGAISIEQLARELEAVTPFVTEAVQGFVREA